MSSRSATWTDSAMSRIQAISGPSSPLAILEPPQTDDPVTQVFVPPHVPRRSGLHTPPTIERCHACARWNRLKVGETNFGHCCAHTKGPWPYWKTAPGQYVVTYKDHGAGCAAFVFA